MGNVFAKITMRFLMVGSEFHCSLYYHYRIRSIIVEFRDIIVHVSISLPSQCLYSISSSK